MFAIAGLMTGANHIRVKCYDGVTRMGRIKGKIKRSGLDSRGGYPHRHSLELPGRCDIISRYTGPQVEWRRGEGTCKQPVFGYIVNSRNE